MTSSLKQTAYEHVKGKLFSGELAGGDRLSTLALARELEISNMPIREALNQLQSEGLVERRSNSGCVVRKLDIDELDELFVLRELLESFAAVECARHISRRNLGELEDICLEMRDTARDARRVNLQNAAEVENIFLEIRLTDIKFHQTLIRAAGNRWLSRAAENLVPISQLFNYQSAPEGSDPRWFSARHYRIHTLITRVIRKGDVHEARSVLEAHVRCGNPLYEVRKLKFPGGMDAHLKPEHAKRRRHRW